VAIHADPRRAAIHSLGILDVPAGVDPGYWSSLDTDSLIPRKRQIALRTDPTVKTAPPPARRSASLPGVRRLPAPPSGPVYPPSEPEPPADPTEMPFLDHLEEFRWSLLKSIFAVAICVILGWFLSDAFYTTVTALSNKVELPLIFTKVMEPIMIKLQMAVVIGIVLSLPFIFYFMWSFIAPGLYQNEKRWVLPMVLTATACFLAGAALAFFVIIPYMLQFMKMFIPDDVSPLITIGDFISVLLKFTILFGVLFELPVVSFALARIGILKYEWLAKYRRYAIVIIFIVAAIFTPPDPISQSLMAVPLVILYEISILVARFAGRQRHLQAA
jgi:sec-independent protein translocase protein TatC